MARTRKKPSWASGAFASTSSCGREGRACVLAHHVAQRQHGGGGRDGGGVDGSAGRRRSPGWPRAVLGRGPSRLRSGSSRASSAICSTSARERGMVCSIWNGAHDSRLPCNVMVHIGCDTALWSHQSGFHSANGWQSCRGCAILPAVMSFMSLGGCDGHIRFVRIRLGSAGLNRRQLSAARLLGLMRLPGVDGPAGGGLHLAGAAAGSLHDGYPPEPGIATAAAASPQIRAELDACPLQHHHADRLRPRSCTTGTLDLLLPITGTAPLPALFSAPIPTCIPSAAT